MKKSKKVLIILVTVVSVAAIALAALYLFVYPNVEVYVSEPLNKQAAVYIEICSFTMSSRDDIPIPEYKRKQIEEFSERADSVLIELKNKYTGEGTHIDCEATAAGGKMTVSYTGIGVLADGSREQVNRSEVFDFVFKIRQ